MIMSEPRLTEADLDRRQAEFDAALSKALLSNCEQVGNAVNSINYQRAQRIENGVHVLLAVIAAAAIGAALAFELSWWPF
jgi:hypothetical protein